MRSKAIPTLYPSGTSASTKNHVRLHFRAYKDYKTRLASEPWRTAYSSAGYRRDRAAALDVTGGRCGSCGAVVATKTPAGVWSMEPGAGVHHTTRLADGGRAAALVPLCGRCHAAADAAERRKAKAAGRGRYADDRAAAAWMAIHRSDASTGE